MMGSNGGWMWGFGGLIVLILIIALIVLLVGRRR
jgi:hypothetical protein